MKKPVLSKRAQKLLARIEEGHFYRPYEGSVPKAMKELVDAKLVGICGRVAVIVAAYVPAKGYKPFVPESFKGERKHQEKVTL